MKRNPNSHRFDTQFKEADWEKILEKAEICKMKPTLKISKNI
jgi:hypothetical protein